MIGDSAVGKTTIIHQYAHNEKRSKYIPTVGLDFVSTKFKTCKGTLLPVHIWDTAGHERFNSLVPNMYKKAQGVVLVFDITSEKSFISVKKWLDSIQ